MLPVIESSSRVADLLQLREFASHVNGKTNVPDLREVITDCRTAGLSLADTIVGLSALVAGGEIKIHQYHQEPAGQFITICFDSPIARDGWQDWKDFQDC